MRKVYNKIVRDLMENIYQEDIVSGKILAYKLSYKSGQELNSFLVEKLKEETEEVDGAFDDNEKLKEEIADVVEVLNGIMYLKGFSKEEIELIRLKKKERRGGFESGLFLENVDFGD